MTTPSTGGNAPIESQGPSTGVAAVTAGSGLPKLRYKLPPELSDGQHWSVVDEPYQVIEAVENWLQEVGHGEEITIKACMMTDEEVNALPSI